MLAPFGTVRPVRERCAIRDGDERNEPGRPAQADARGVLRDAWRPGRAHRLDLHPAPDPRPGLRPQLRPGGLGPRRPQRGDGAPRASLRNALGAVRPAPAARVRTALRRHRLPHGVDGGRVPRAPHRALCRGVRGRVPACPLLVARERHVRGSVPAHRARRLQLERRHRQAPLLRVPDHPARRRGGVAARRGRVRIARHRRRGGPLLPPPRASGGGAGPDLPFPVPAPRDGLGHPPPEGVRDARRDRAARPRGAGRLPRLHRLPDGAQAGAGRAGGIRGRPDPRRAGSPASSDAGCSPRASGRCVPSSPSRS